MTDVKTLLKFVKENADLGRDEIQKDRLVALVRFSIIFESEQMCALGAWDELLGVIQVTRCLLMIDDMDSQIWIGNWNARSRIGGRDV